MIPHSRRAMTWTEFTTAITLVIVIMMVSVPPWLAAQENRRTATALVRMRETAAALQSYFIDHETYPPCAIAQGPSRDYLAQQIWQAESLATIPNQSLTANTFAGPSAGASRMVTFRLPAHSRDGHSLTTPVAYLRRLHEDPFARTRGASFGYFRHASNLGWIVFSVGPDRDENSKDGPGDISPQVEKLYDLNSEFPYMWTPGDSLINATYDPTNGLLSNGDLYRVEGQ